MSVYSTSARRYRTAGWWPVPVHGKQIPAGGATGYRGEVTDEKIDGWISENPRVWVPQPDKTRKLMVASNITLAHRLTVALDVDEYGEKNGVLELAAFARKHGLSPLPATWSSTARGDRSGSRQYLYRLEADTRFKTKPCASVELCCWHHRHTVVAPTIHPGNGRMYAWYEPGQPGIPPTWGEATDAVPTPGQLPMWPADWLEATKGNEANLDPDAEVYGLADLLASFPEGEPDGLIRHLIAKWSDPDEPIDHDLMKAHGINILMLGREGHPGVPELWDVFFNRYADHVREKRPSEFDRDLYGDEGIVALVVRVAQQKPVTPSVWSAELRPVGGVSQEVHLPESAATDDEFAHWTAAYTGFSRPDRLGRRTAWMRKGSVHDLPYHARQLVNDTLAGQYPACSALSALSDACLHHGIDDPRVVARLISVALGAALDAPREVPA